ncbi:MAG TPA: type II secretion system minor pseudopilin GspK [Steroidobacteraceae bacterium]|nr:type II secretion system minor pseudopilin GspK [Steroidobacteraceae bacterium]
MPRAGERGVILLSALILMALAAVVAAAMFFDTGLAARRAATAFAMEEAMQLGQGAEALAAYALSQDTNQTDTPQDAWAQPTDPLQAAPDTVLLAQLYDLQGRFNINTLVSVTTTSTTNPTANLKYSRNENAYKVFTRLLALLQIDPSLADEVVDWIDPDVTPQPQGGEDSLYMSMDPPHLTANIAVTSTSELMQLPGFTRDVYLKLQPHITALPPSVRTINVCMADGFVLDALYAVTKDSSHSEYSLLTPQQLLGQRGGDCFPSQQSLLNEADASSRTALRQMTTQRTNWFQLQTVVRIGTAEFDLYSLMYRNGRTARAVARTVGTE